MRAPVRSSAGSASWLRTAINQDAIQLLDGGVMVLPAGAGNPQGVAPRAGRHDACGDSRRVGRSQRSAPALGRRWSGWALRLGVPSGASWSLDTNAPPMHGLRPGLGGGFMLYF